MTVITIKDNFPAVAAQLKRLADDVGNKVLVRSLNATIDQGKTQMARTISQEFRIAVGAAKDRLKVSKANAKQGGIGFEVSLEATRKGKGRAMNLIAFVENKTTLGEARKRGKKGTQSQVYFQVKRTGGKKFIRGAFIANKGRTLFIRTGKGRLPIKSVSTIDIPSMFNTRRINTTVVKVMRDRFEKNFSRELNVVMQGYLK
jgi:hypothetical protein